MQIKIFSHNNKYQKTIEAWNFAFQHKGHGRGAMIKNLGAYGYHSISAITRTIVDV